MPGLKTLKAISVDLEVLTKDRLRKVIFSLDKSPDGDDVNWKIEFQLLEREDKSEDFGDPLVKLSVDVKKSNQENAEATASKGLTTKQAEHLLGPASSEAKRLKAGKTTEAKAAAAVERTLAKRDA